MLKHGWFEEVICILVNWDFKSNFIIRQLNLIQLLLGTFREFMPCKNKYSSNIT